jgi:hypothetical protein
LVARQVDDTHIVIRASFDFKDLLLHTFPDTRLQFGRRDAATSCSE